jgi:hypothetical protein
MTTRGEETINADGSCPIIIEIGRGDLGGSPDGPP